MSIVLDQLLVHPHHGPGKVTEFFERTRNGRDAISYMSVSMLDSSMTIAVPLANVDVVGLRPVMRPEDLRVLTDRLQSPSRPSRGTWTQRFKDCALKLSTGRLADAADVARDLTRRSTTSDLSFEEKRQLRSARRPIVTEFALALDITIERADEVVDSILAGQPAPPDSSDSDSVSALGSEHAR